ILRITYSSRPLRIGASFSVTFMVSNSYLGCARYLSQAWASRAQWMAIKGAGHDWGVCRRIRALDWVGAQWSAVLPNAEGPIGAFVFLDRCHLAASDHLGGPSGPF